MDDHFGLREGSADLAFDLVGNALDFGAGQIGHFAQGFEGCFKLGFLRPEALLLLKSFENLRPNFFLNFFK